MTSLACTLAIAPIPTDAPPLRETSEYGPHSETQTLRTLENGTARQICVGHAER
jgi:hypothetical protein